MSTGPAPSSRVSRRRGFCSPNRWKITLRCSTKAPIGLLPVRGTSAISATLTTVSFPSVTGGLTSTSALQSTTPQRARSRLPPKRGFPSRISSPIPDSSITLKTSRRASRNPVNGTSTVRPECFITFRATGKRRTRCRCTRQWLTAFSMCRADTTKTRIPAPM